MFDPQPMRHPEARRLHQRGEGSRANRHNSVSPDSPCARVRDHEVGMGAR